MFDTPNNHAFNQVSYFLFTMLDAARAAEDFKDCSFLLGGVVAVREFRRQCLAWLKDIANEDQTILPQITPSLFVYPGGPKIVNVFCQLARHVVIEDMKRNCTGTDTSFAEVVKLTPQDSYMADARCRVAYNKLLQIFQKEDFVIQEYEKKAQLLITEIKQMKSEYAALQIQPGKIEQNDQKENDRMKRIQKVRSMWTLITEVLASLKKEKEVVDSVLEDCAVQCILDGTSVVISVPRILADRIEGDMHQRFTGNTYEDENLNFVTVIQLLNEALKTLKDERCETELNQELQDMENSLILCSRALHDLKAKRLKIEQEHLVSTISKEQGDWEAKWKNCLGECPFNLILDQCPALKLMALQPQSSDVEEDDDDEDVFSQLLVSLPDVCDAEVHDEKDDGPFETVMDVAMPSPSCRNPPLPPRISSVPLKLSEVSENRDVSTEKNLHTKTSEREKKPVPPKLLENGRDESASSETRDNAGDHIIQTESADKEDFLRKSKDDLAEQVGRTVMSDSPESSEEKGMALEDLISSLAFNPFLTRKQIPRTPENLLTEIRSSWRKAIQSEGSSETELSQTEVTVEAAPIDVTSTVQNAADSALVCSIPASPLPDFDLPLSERKSQLSSTEFRPQEQMKINHIIESPVSETSGMLKSEGTEEQELECTIWSKSCVEDTKELKSMNTPNICSEDNRGTGVLPSDSFEGSVVDGMLHWDVPSLLNFVCCESNHLGIWNETLPEEFNTDSNISASSEDSFCVTDSVFVTGSSKNKGDTEKSKLDPQSPFNTHKSLERTACRSEDELHQTHNRGESVACRSALSHTPEGKDEFYSPLKLFCLDEKFTRTPSPVAFNEIKYSLSSLLVSCQHLGEMASRIHEVPFDLIPKSEDEEQLNKKPDTKEPSSG
ncbi:PREDICTED: HAUS augmin-like complex subunit 6 [Chaetura pelagica]|uniref:HAUS augmin-like complex subunit 6 n=1 Tax=Chaetura pelagica TaxID=8897 RepID=UPI000523EBD8|nr:PREDICTED: HAUS augmin-like complex subunit 6 [Chaetura pelagica]